MALTSLDINPTPSPSPNTGRGINEGDFQIVWPEMVAEEQSMTLRKVDFAYSQGIIDKTEARLALGL